MTTDSTHNARYRACLGLLEERGQRHVLRWWNELGTHQREHLLADIESIRWDLVDRLIQSHVLREPVRAVPVDLSPPTVYPQPPGPPEEALYDQAVHTGRELIRAGRVAPFTVAGGQGTRLGYDGPKGAVPVTPVGDRTLFQLFAESILATRRRFDVHMPWYIMTSPTNHSQTLSYLEHHDFFGLPEKDVILFTQGTLPSLDFQGQLLLAQKHRLALAPDGHGGALSSLVRSGALADMRSRGVEIISYFQVDNPLVKVLDPLFIGLHATTGSEMAVKVVRKAHELERVGNVCVHDGKVMVIEYSDFPDACTHAKSEDGSRRFDSGNLAVHLLNVDFVNRAAGRSFELPFRRAEKAVAYVDDAGRVQEPAAPNAIKLETFIFDLLPLANSPLVLEVDRAEEFSPVKNATGVDSLESSRRDQAARACRWLEVAGLPVPRNTDGTPDVLVAISPLLALDTEELRANAHRVPALNPGDAVYLE